MDCRTFRKNHLSYLDDTLPGIEMERERSHLRFCEACARHDASIRRALFLLKNINISSVEPSGDFTRRLRARLAAEARVPERPFRGPGVGLFAGVAAGVVALGLVTLRVLEPAEEGASLPRLPAVVATVPPEGEPGGDELTAPAFVASMSTGMPVWPALVLAEEGPLRFASSVELRPASWTPGRP